MVRRSGDLALLGLGAALFAALLVAFWPFTVDDAYITLRYSAHLAAGLGPDWNPGEAPAEGYTTFLWMALMALPHRLGLDGITAAKATGTACMIGAVAVTGLCAARIAGDLPPAPRRFAGCAAAFMLACVPATSVHAVSGMETGLFTLLVTAHTLALIALCDTPRPRLTWLVAGLGLAAALTRPEANLLVAVSASVALLRLQPDARRRLALAVLLAHVLPGAAYFAWRVGHYGQLLPLPFYVKTTAEPALLAGRADALDFVYDLTIRRFYVCAPLFYGLWTYGRRLAAPLGAAAALFVFYLFPAHIMAFDWRYLFPILPLLVAVTAAGLAHATQRLGAPLAAVRAATAVLIAVGYLGGIDAHIQGKVDYGAGLARAHIPIGRALARVRDQVARPLLASLDCGAIPYYSGWITLDTYGLNDATIARAGRGDAAYVLAQDPEVLILVSSQRDTFSPQFAWEQPLYDGARARGLERAAAFEFMPDYHLWVLTKPGSPARAVLTETP